jgi:predicted transposase YdaD
MTEYTEYFDSDGFWKDLIDRFFYPLLKRAVPELHERADITKKQRALDKEFRDILNTGNPEIHASPRFADFVIEVPMKGGDAEYLLFHAEAQGRGGRNLAERMNIYRCLIVAHYHREPVALAVITAGRRRGERFYSHSHYGTRVIYAYNNLVLSELDDRELQTSGNPIDLALYAAKCALGARDELQKFNYLRTLLGLLSERGWDRDDKRDILLFLERAMNLKDRKLERKYTEYRDQLSKEGKIVYIPLGERELAREIEQRGMSKGKEEARVEIARNFLTNGVSPDIIAQSTGLPIERIRSLIN